ncbi:methylated-DNA--[protein]-cysteine S-methyltransferase [Paenarthrobacter sp. Z7-10]|uniref:methylated-DNA--[protein]-cysteine S-methyltransferase n=1 Tax=Paenarthrobacter sp. Z7-10 TaxID=2787635 RepID=UPI0022A9793B|nr:methylated-DNA--[protein]-cysteine S-methyltransferase [Paenarthrobacter sp. Z7-10]MCZ2401785.1 methylated-DNA--[protein]-cysteine S-methyltransferase [Paenarthrobacter sp. Z7-10]
MKTYTTTGSPIGELTLVADDRALCAVYMAEHKRRPGNSAFGTALAGGFAAAIEQLNEYFAGQRTEFELTTAAAGNTFQHRVWQQLMLIPYGETRSYGDLAASLGDRSLAQAVGAANGRNPLSIIVPCHRVLGATGSLVGYAGGLERKEYLLQLENPARVSTGLLF